ncbi:LacI family DNA-binding transcriptional regulator [Cupriavidus necator]|uniref:LacI family DNA-binding transcriptional regulator n=1 Tax=Cupriavidus necator TaxID=106590 RepID=UPI0005B55A1C|nr:LacI family DNA-binding transcriptional regulator [Cupriavidus necator]
MSNNSSSFETKRAGIKEVAKRAGVGIASVSRVLSGQPGSSPQLIERVMQAARELGYMPNLMAQNLRRRTSKSIGFVGSDITNPLLASIVGGAESVLSAAGYSVLLTNSGGQPEVDAQRIEVLLQRQVDGLIVLPALEDNAATLAALASTTAPVVIIDRAMAGSLDVHYVLSDHYLGMGEATRHLLKLGHRRLGLAVGQDVRPSRERLRAVEDTFREKGLVADLMVDSGSLSPEHGERAMERFLTAARPPTAVILGGNQLLEGALHAVRKRGLRLGEQISLVCCDDVALSRMYDPPIATVLRDTALLGQRAAEVLLEQIKDPHPTTPVLLPTSFVQRPSCGPVVTPKKRPSRRPG